MKNSRKFFVFFTVVVFNVAATAVLVHSLPAMRLAFNEFRADSQWWQRLGVGLLWLVVLFWLLRKPNALNGVAFAAITLLAEHFVLDRVTNLWPVLFVVGYFAINIWLYDLTHDLGLLSKSRLKLDDLKKKVDPRNAGKTFKTP